MSCDGKTGIGLIFNCFLVTQIFWYLISLQMNWTVLNGKPKCIAWHIFLSTYFFYDFIYHWLVRSYFLHFCTLENCLNDILRASISFIKIKVHVLKGWICLTKCTMQGFIQNLNIFLFCQNQNVFRKAMQSSIKVR